MTPRLFIVPGLYEGPGSFEPLSRRLNAFGFANIHVTKLLSTGTTSKDQPKMMTMDDDISFIQVEMRKFVDDVGNDPVIVILHSAGGFLGSAAMQGLSVDARKKAGKPGGITRIIAVTAALAPSGFEHKPLPFMKFDDEAGTQTPSDIMNQFFNDFSPAEGQAWAAKMQAQPGKGWDGMIRFAGWLHIPLTYIIAERDQTITPDMQEHFASAAGATIKRLDAGHMVQLSKTEELAQMISAFYHNHNKGISRVRRGV
ncbi:hypothetical protein HIM_00486 [Hirsutella minnesotensis 3608]|nr:hypothetical protein HIM_00486 [Hirsutella minnesotensis 3608]